MKVATWVGDARTSRCAPRSTGDVAPDRAEPGRGRGFVEPHTAALHVLVRAVATSSMDGSKDDRAGSRIRTRVILEHEVRKFETEQTHYIDDVDAGWGASSRS